MKKQLFTLLFFFLLYTLQAQTIFGKWYTKDDKTGKIDSVVEIYEKEGKAFAKIIEVLKK